MKILIVDDSAAFVHVVVDTLRKAGYQTFGIIPDTAGAYGENWSQRTAIEEANVVFLDHNMPGENGQQWLEHWRERNDFSGKKIIGTSNQEQPYVSEQVLGNVQAIMEKVKALN